MTRLAMMAPLTAPGRPGRRDGARTGVVLAAAVTVLALGATSARAQVQHAYEPVQAPGWTLTPSLTYSGLWDDNVALASEVQAPEDAYVSVVSPGGDLQYTGRQTRLTVGYRGAFRAYQDLRGLNTYEQRANLDFQRRLSRRISFGARQRLAFVPTTDEIELAGVFFRRTGSRVSETSAGVDAVLTRRVNLQVDYSFQWIQFDQEDFLRPLLRGGIGHNVEAQLTYAIAPRLHMGAHYGLRRAVIGEDAPASDIHTGALVLTYEIAPRTTVQASLGMSRLIAEGEPARTGPAVRAAVIRRVERATLEGFYDRKFVPAFGLGGAIESEQYGGSFRMPLARNRIYWVTGIVWRDSEPVTLGGLPLRSMWAHSTVGFALTRWVRVEGFIAHIEQDSRLAGGRIDRNRVGFQVTTSKPMRVR